MVRFIALVLCLFSIGVSQAQENCVAEGDAIGVYPGAPSNCCQGLVRLPPPAGLYGSNGTCHKQVNGQFCFGDGKIFRGRPHLPCCPGLQMSMNTGANEFSCQPQIVSCVPEGQYMVPGPRNPGCCQGLEPVMEDPRRMGGARCMKPQTCVSEGNPFIVYPGSPNCCEGLVLGSAPLHSPYTFAPICVRASTGAQVNDTLEPRESIGNHGVRLTPDPIGVRAQ